MMNMVSIVMMLTSTIFALYASQCFPDQLLRARELLYYVLLMNCAATAFMAGYNLNYIFSRKPNMKEDIL